MLDENDKKLNRLANGKVNSGVNLNNKAPLAFSPILASQQGKKKDDLTVDQQKAPSSRPSSARWKAATSAVMASNMLTKLGKNKGTGKKSTIQRKIKGSNAYIPVLPLWLAVIFLIFNCIVPGLGTIMSSFTFCCVGTTYDQTDRKQLKDKIIGIVMTNFFTGVAQLFTTTFLLVGWFWSISSGVTMVYLALEAREKLENTSVDILVNNNS